MSRGPRRICSCGTVHWSTQDEECRACRGLDMPRRERKVRIGPKLVPLRRPRVRRGLCLDRVRACRIDWGPQHHRHCPEQECRRPMAVGADRCSRCEALLILQERPEQPAVAAVPRQRWRQLPLPSIEEAFESLGRSA